MADVIVSLAAREDLDAIDRFSLERFGPEFADLYGDGIEDVLARLEFYPELGAPFADVSPPLRAISYCSHKLYYDFDGSVVMIVRVLLQSADAPAMLAS